MPTVGPRHALPVERRARQAAVVLALVFLAAHLLFLPASLEDLDSINFALGLRQFDVAHHQPHPPGYPLYIAVGKLARTVIPGEARALGTVSGLSGALGAFALIALFRRIDERWPWRWSAAAALLTMACPLYWFTAARPLSDVPGLAAALAVQALALSAATSGGIVGACALAAFATGIRSQVAWLTAPVLLIAILRHRPASRGRFAAAVVIALIAGAALWAVPLVVLSGGPAAYWRALFAQGAEDLTGIQMLWTRPTPREFVTALYYAFVAPWAAWPVALGVWICAAAGVWTLYRRAPRSLLLLLAAFGPYLVFDILFQETFTSRYALPLVPPIAYLALRGVALIPGQAGLIVALGGAAACATLAGVSVRAYAVMEAPAFRLLADMRAASSIPRRPSAAPVLAMHRREDLDLRRPMQWVGADLPAFSGRLAAPPKHEWLELVNYWNGGGRAPVWFVADPQRTDVALVDHAPDRRGVYQWPLAYPILLGGTRPGEMNWYVFDAPGWYLGEGWSLTPETAGVAAEDHRGPGLAPIVGWIRRRPEAMTLLIGGRNLQVNGPPAHVTVALDDRPLDDLVVKPGFFLRMLEVPAGAIAGAGEYARLSVAADRPQVAIEQFDAQSAPGRIVSGFGEGWHEMEYNPVTGRTWRWMSERGILHARTSRRSLRFTMSGATEGFSRPTAVELRIGDRVAARWIVDGPFSVQATLAGEWLAAEDTALVIASDQFFVPAERSGRSADRRHLALRIFDVRLASEERSQPTAR